MLTRLGRAAALLGLPLVALALAAPPAPAATQQEIDRAIKAGADFLRGRNAQAVGGADAVYGIGPVCLSGLALLESGTPVGDPAIKNITAAVRDAACTRTQTYQIALCLMYLDRHGDPADVPLVQMLAVRLLAGQTNKGGWTYDCVGQVSQDDAKRFRAMKASDAQPGKLHPDVEAYAQALAAARQAAAGQPMAGIGGEDDNSNTQFGSLAVWMARKHGVPVEAALDLIEKRFMATQFARSGNWSYSSTAGAANEGSPSMYCAGLISMATAVARAEERRVKEKQPEPKPKVDAKPDPKRDDPFYNPPAGTPVPKDKQPARPTTARDRTVQLALAGLGAVLADNVRSGRGVLVSNGTHGHGDLYFLWSLERVGVVYGLDKIGGIDWYGVGSTAIVRSQGNDGAWHIGGYNPDVNTSFAVLFLCRSNLARDLSSKVQRDPTTVEMRAGTGPAANDLLPNRPTSPANAAPVVPSISLPNPTNDEAVTRAVALLKATGADWKKLLQEARDAKGPQHTRTMVLTATHAVGPQKAEAREALAERLCRMTPATLRAMLKADEAELRRAAALACGMKDDKGHVADLIELIIDPDEQVTRAAKAALKSLTGQDHGPPAGASAGQKALALTAWREWFAAQKK